MNRTPLLILGTVASLMCLTVILNYFTPPLFVQVGTHYFAVVHGIPSSLYSRKPSEGPERYVAVRQDLLVAVASDPNPLHWLPVEVTSASDITDSENDVSIRARFKCPSEYLSAQEYADAVGQFVSDYEKEFPAANTDDMLAYRNQLLEQHYCAPSQ